MDDIKLLLPCLERAERDRILSSGRARPNQHDIGQRCCFQLLRMPDVRTLAFAHT